MDDSYFRMIFVLLVLVCLGAYFSATETAFTSLSRSRLKSLAAFGDKKAGQTLKMADQFDRVLSTMLIGNNLVSIIAASLATVMFTNLFPYHGVLISTVVMTVVVLIFGDITPKSMAKEAPLRFAIAATPLLKFFIFILWPLNLLFGLWRMLLARLVRFKDHESPAEEELLTIVEEAEAGGDIDPLDGDLIRSAIEFNDLDVSDILTPRVNVVAISEDASMEEIEKAFVENRFSRLPVYSGSIDSIVGVLLEKDFLAERYYGKHNLKAEIKKVLYASPTMKISTLLRRLQREKLHLAVVLDEFGGTEGIVTLEDILEELVGEIWDEHDEVVETITAHADVDNHYTASGDANMEDVFELLGIDTEHMDYESTTVGGWLTEQLDEIPSSGKELIYEDIRFTVLESDERMVKMVGIEKMPPEEAADQAE